jgi:hypothetical protein
MLPLRLRALWLTGAVLLVAAVLVGALSPQATLPATGFDDRTEHVVAFLTLTLWFAGMTRRRVYAPLCAWLLGFGAGIEAMQRLTAWGRVADPFDFAADAIGVALGLALALAGLGGWMARVERVLLRP